MSKAILVIDMPDCCYECFSFDDNGDHPTCLVTREYRGYKFRAREQKMDKCPLKPLPEKYNIDNVVCDRDYNGDFEYGYNQCIDEILGQ